MDISRATAGQIEEAVEESIGHIAEIMLDFNDVDDRDIYCAKIRERLAPYKENTTASRFRKIITGRIKL
jgi:hypothetical protein